MSDKLEKMWAQQTEFMKLLKDRRNFPEFPVDLKSKLGQKSIDDIVFHCMKELFEAAQLLKNSKAHRKTEILDFDRDAYIEELIDAQHLLFEIAIVSGVSLEEFFDAYLKKGIVNDERIKSGY